MINGKLEDPFTKYANGLNDLKWLSPIDVKTELTKKFYEEIDFEKIENYGKIQQKNFLNNHPDIAEKIRNSQASKKSANLISESEIKNNNINYIKTNSDNNMDEFVNLENFNENNNLSKNQFYPEENNYNVNNYINKVNNTKNYNEKIKLVNIIRDLEQKVIERDEIIEYQNKQIEQIKNRINFIQNLKNNNL